MSKLTVALVAHDHKKPELLVWVKQHIKILEQCNLVATGTTGGLINKETGLEVTRYKSGPLGGDQQIGALIAENKLDAHYVIHAVQLLSGLYINMAHLEAWDTSAIVSEAQIVESISSYDFSQYNPVSIQLVNR